MSTHTSGPWRNGGQLGAASGWIIGPNKEQIAVVYGPNTNAEAAGNCRLIAAAPELLEALRGVMRFALPITHHDVEDYNRARAAIAAATGEG